MLKKLVILLTFTSIIGCSDDDKITHYYQALPIETISLPSSFTLDETYTIDFSFVRPTTCHTYSNVLLSSEEENRTFAVSSLVVTNAICDDISESNMTSQSFEFKVLFDQVYKFHIWKGKDSNGNDIYETYEIPVE